jgi:hypothetical protein
MEFLTIECVVLQHAVVIGTVECTPQGSSCTWPTSFASLHFPSLLYDEQLRQMVIAHADAYALYEQPEAAATGVLE